MHLEPGVAVHPLLKGGLDLLSLVYKGGSALQRGWRRLRRRGYPSLYVVSVDNLSFGGTGKTPFIVALGEELERRRLPFAVVTRGYRSRFERIGARVRDGLGPDEVGDEAMLLHGRFPGQAILVGRDRHRSLRRAVELGCRVAVIDDGLQSTDIAVDARVLLIHPGHPFYYLRHFPGTGAGAAWRLYFGAVPPRWEGRAVSYGFCLDGLFDSGGRPVEVGDAPLAAFAALADNARFRRDLETGHRLVAFRPFPDHHRYTAADLESLERLGRESGAAWLVCSEKDYVKARALPPPGIPFLHTRNRIQLPTDVIGQIVSHAEGKGHRQT